MPLGDETSPQRSSAIAQLDLIEAAAKRAEIRKNGPSLRAAPERPEGADDTLYSLLGELRADIQALKAERTTLTPPPPPSPESQMQSMLAELHRDIEVLKGEQVAWTATQKERELQAMLQELRHDIHILSDQAPKHAAAKPSEGRWRMSPDQVLKLGIPLGVVAGIAAAFVLMLATGQFNVGTRTSPQLAGFGSVTNAQNRHYAATPEQLMETAGALLGKGDIVFARRVLANAVSQGSALSSVELAKTYDPELLARLYNPSGAAPDESRAMKLYEVASRAGNFEATMRLEQLRKTNSSP